MPAPIDTDWHWWGKLNAEGEGVVVVIRGNGGSDSRKINIPWVNAKTKYRLRSLFSEKELGKFTGAQLKEGALTLSLPLYGQEIIELINTKAKH